MDNQAELDMLLSKIKENSLLLLKEQHSSNVLLQSATSRGMQVLRGSQEPQLYVDLCSIALTLLIQNRGK